jgi:hypothetical protein
LRNQNSINIKNKLYEIKNKNKNNESIEEQQLIQLTDGVTSINFIEPSTITGMEFFVPIDHLIRYKINNKLIAIYI